MSDEIKNTLNEMKSAVEELRSTNEANLANRDVVLETKEAALNTRISELTDQVAELTRNASRPAATEAVEKGAFAKELRSYLQSGIATRAVTTSTGGDAAAIGTAGGYLVPEEFDRNLVSLAQNVSPLISEVTVNQAGSPDVKIHVNLGGAGSSWVTEDGTSGMNATTNTPTFAEVAVPFGKLFAKPLISTNSVNDIYFDIEAFVTNEVALKFGRDVGNAIINGSGSGQPKGIIQHTVAATADASRAFGTIEYIASGTAASLPAANTFADKYIAMIAALNPIYRTNAKWYMPRAVAANLRTLKDGNNNYIWQTSLVLGQPSSFLGFPVVETEDLPAVGAGTLSVMFGDLKAAYRMYDLVGTEMLRDPYSFDNYIALKTSKRFGGTVANTEAVKLLKCAAS